MTTNYGQQVYSQGGGTASTTLLDAVREPRNPNSGDASFSLGKNWVNTNNDAVWYLASYTSASGRLQANWVNISGGSILMGVETINTIAPDGSGNFTIESMDGSVTITPEVNAIDLSVSRSPTKYDGNSGGDVVPNVGNQLFIIGTNSTGINVVGNSPINTLTISAFPGTTSQYGTLLLATNAQAIAGMDGANAVTSVALGAKLGTQTPHSLAVFEGTSSALTALGAAINGQLPIGSTGADPVLANITSTGGTITVTNGPGTINIDLAGGHGAIEEFIPDSGTNPVVPNVSGQVTMAGSGSITTVGSLNTLTFQLTGLTNHSILVGAGTTTITKVAPSATLGIPLISQGVAADPTFGTAVVAGGGTGAVTFTAYAPVCGGTTSTGVLQSADTGIGSSGFVLTSTGAASLPTWQAIGASSITLTGDTGGGLTSGSFTFNAHTNCGSSVIFAGAGTTLSLKIEDSNMNTLIGVSAGNGGISGTQNTSLGNSTFNALTSGGANAALGYQALKKLTTGGSNTAIGYQALESSTTGTANTALGLGAFNNLVTGTQGIAIGIDAGTNYTTSESSNIIIGNSGTIGESNVIRIGTQGTGSGLQNICFISGITGAIPTSANTPQVVLCDNAGNLAPISSSTSGFVLTSNGSATPSFQAAASSSITITGNSGGGLTGNSFTFTGGTTGLTFSGAGTTETLTGTLVVANGGTGNTTFTAYSVVCAGTTATGVFQNVSGVGTAGQVLTSNGAAALPTWQNGASILTITSVNNGASPYTVLASDEFIACQTSTGVITIKLPNAPTTGRVIRIKDSNGAAATSNISVTTVGGVVTIDGQTTYTMATNYQSINVVFDGSNYEVF